MSTAVELPLVALIPAAGRSRRMGGPKLLLKLGETTIIRRLVDTLLNSGIKEIFVLVRSDDHALRQELSEVNCQAVVAPVDPPEMRDSVQLLVETIAQRRRQNLPQGWLLIPADHPFLEPAVLSTLIDNWRQNPQRIVLPIHNQQRGHPTLLPWSLTDEISAIPVDRGLNWLIRSRPEQVIQVPCSQASVLFDLDTPADYQRALQLDLG